MMMASVASVLVGLIIVAKFKSLMMMMILMMMRTVWSCIYGIERGRGATVGSPCKLLLLF